MLQLKDESNVYTGRYYIMCTVVYFSIDNILLIFVHISFMYMVILFSLQHFLFNFTILFILSVTLQIYLNLMGFFLHLLYINKFNRLII